MNVWAQTMLLWSWQSLLLIGFVLVIVRLSRSQSGASRHSFWLLSIAVISVLPVVNAIVHALPVEAPAVASIPYITQLPVMVVEALPITTQPSSAVRDFITPSLFGFWIAGVLISAVRSVRTGRRWRRIVRSAVGVDRTGFPVTVGYSTEVEVPVLAGTLRPMIVLPMGIETWTSAEERRAVLLHELAHFERRDHWVSPVQAGIAAIFFFHPAVRYALRQLVLERELACDERVLSMGTNPATYAEIILRVAEHSIPGLQSDCPAFNSPGKILERRIEMILSYPSMVSSRWHVPAVGRAAIVLALAALLLPQRAIVAETTAPPPLEVRVASFPPLVQSVSVIASATGASAEPVLPVASEPAPQAQTTPAPFGAVSGTVIDPSGALVPGVSVTLVSSTGQEVKTATTNLQGFVFNDVPPGEWSLQTRIPNFTNTQRTIQVRSGETQTQNIAIAVAKIATTVIVSAARPSAIQNAANRPLPQRIGGDIVPPRLIAQVKPQYPAAERASGVQDYVLLQAVIGKDGTISSVQVDPSRLGLGNPWLDQAAINAVQQWRYVPAILNGVPIEVATTITVNFTLD